MVCFDEAIQKVVGLVSGAHAEGEITLVRDPAGRLTVVLGDGAIAEGAWDQLAEKLHRDLGAFSPGARHVLLRRSDLIDEGDVLESPDRVPLPEFQKVWLVDRLLTNLDWLRAPRVVSPRIPTAVAFSLKGGVGRSTAVAALGWHLARQGKRVLAVDFDLEAPGLGQLLLDEPPDYGLVDWLVEALVDQERTLDLRDFLARSAVADGTPGEVRVMPALGQKTREYVAKLGRVFLPGLTSTGEEVGLGARLKLLLDALGEQMEPPEVILLDARAGIHDIGAAAVTQLGGEVFLFARDEPQSWQTYRLLLEHLARAKGISYGMPQDDLRWRLKMVAAQLEKTEGAKNHWVEASYETWAALYDDESESSENGPAAKTFAREDSEAPHYPLVVYFDGGLRGASFASSALRPAWEVVEAAFGSFLSGATARLLTQQEASLPGTPEVAP
jgi:hypothetical protein